jgi:His/Glu/Gln/Arg/opine family amino acid ABC transporter permease subunit
MQLILDNLGLFAAGLGWTFRLAVVTLLISTVISAIIGTLSVTRSRALRAIALVYVELFRDIPLLVNALFVFFGAPLVGIPLEPFAGLFTLLVQATSLASLVGVPEFFRIGQIVIERTTMMSGHSPAFVIYGGLLIVYYLICSVLTAGTRWLEDRIANRTQRLSPARAVVPEVRAQESV